MVESEHKARPTNIKAPTLPPTQAALCWPFHAYPLLIDTASWKQAFARCKQDCSLHSHVSVHPTWASLFCRTADRKEMKQELKAGRCCYPWQEAGSGSKDVLCRTSSLFQAQTFMILRTGELSGISVATSGVSAQWTFTIAWALVVPWGMSALGPALRGPGSYPETHAGLSSISVLPVCSCFKCSRIRSSSR